jgi:hypothetical protein
MRLVYDISPCKFKYAIADSKNFGTSMESEFATASCNGIPKKVYFKELSSRLSERKLLVGRRLVFAFLGVHEFPIDD